MRTEIEVARAFAFAAHGAIGQKRKYDGTTYIYHPERVVKIVRDVTCDTNTLCAAWLHDVIEDTGISHDDLEFFFNTRICEYVYWLTESTTLKDGNREQRKRMERNKLQSSPHPVKTIKLADLLDNSESIIFYDKDFSKFFMKEVKLLLNVLKVGNEVIYKRLENVVNDYYKEGRHNDDY